MNTNWEILNSRGTWLSHPQKWQSTTETRIVNLTFIGPCVVIYFYSKTNQIHHYLKFILYYFVVTLYLFRTVFPSIVRSSRLYIQQQAYVKQALRLLGTKSNRHMSNRYCDCLVHTATGICQTDTAIAWYKEQQAYVKQVLRLLGTYSNRHMSNRYCYCLLASSSSICLTYSCCWMYSIELLTMDGKTVRNR